jgi:hypothetical protein
MEKFSKKTAAAVAAAVVLGGLAWYLFFVAKVFDFKHGDIETAIKAYELYTAQETQSEIALFFADPQNDGFKIRPVKIFDSAEMVNRVKQALLLLLSEPAEGYLAVVPEGTLLKEAYLDANSICYLDFSGNLISGHRGGTTGEYLTVYAIINTVLYNFPRIKGVRLLVEGAEVETLAGHINTAGIFSRSDAAEPK